MLLHTLRKFQKEMYKFWTKYKTLKCFIGPSNETLDRDILIKKKMFL